jgi:hypothetical protein
MLIKQLIRETLELQGFRIESVEKKDSELLVTIQADLRYHPRCGVCGTSGYKSPFLLMRSPGSYTRRYICWYTLETMII